MQLIGRQIAPHIAARGQPIIGGNKQKLAQSAQSSQPLRPELHYTTMKKFGLLV